jgi:hypothetical protein
MEISLFLKLSLRINQKLKNQPSKFKRSAELTALSAVLHVEELLKNQSENKVYFSHQLHQPESLFKSLEDYETINIKMDS